MPVHAPDLISELLRGMRLSGVKYRRIEASAPFGVAFSHAPGKAQFHFVSRGPAVLKMLSGALFTLNSGDALFIPNGDAHALLSDEHADVTPVSAFPSEPICNSVCDIHCEPCPDSENVVIFSGDRGARDRRWYQVQISFLFLCVRKTVQHIIPVSRTYSPTRSFKACGLYVINIASP
jgi:hypothetical protein